MKKNQGKELSEKKQDKAEKSLARFKLPFIIASTLVLVGVGSLTAYAFYSSHRILPHTIVAGVAVGGLTKEEAKASLQQKEESFATQDLKLSSEGKERSLAVKDLGLEYNNDAVIEEAYAPGKTGNFNNQIKDFLASLVRKRYLEVDIKPLSDTVKQTLFKKALNDFETQPSETTLQFIPGKVEIIPGKVGKKLDYTDFSTKLYASFKANKPNITISLESFNPEVTVAQAESAKQTATAILGSAWTLQAGGTSVTIEPKKIAEWLSVEVKREAEVATGLNLVLKDDAVKQEVAAFATRAAIKPTNAGLKQEGSALVISQADKDGMSVQVDVNAQKLKSALLSAKEGVSHVVSADTTIVKADLRADTIASLGLKELIGAATTDFVGSPNNRKFNIKRGQESLTGGLIKNGETYSTTGALGPVDESTGYLPELVIKDNRTIPEAGGGLCQVSTTLFRSVLNAGLPIVERTNHAYRVGYYERGVGPGLDATVYIPNPDFKWKNDTGNAVYIQSYIVGTKITFELYGTNDGRVATLSAPEILEEIPVGNPIYSNTDTLFKGEQKQIETAHSGAKTRVTYTVNRNGTQLNKQIFNSYYKPWPAQYLVGTKER